MFVFTTAGSEGGGGSSLDVEEESELNRYGNQEYCIGGGQRCAAIETKGTVHKTLFCLGGKLPWLLFIDSYLLLHVQCCVNKYMWR